MASKSHINIQNSSCTNRNWLNLKKRAGKMKLLKSSLHSIQTQTKSQTNGSTIYTLPEHLKFFWTASWQRTSWQVFKLIELGCYWVLHTWNHVLSMYSWNQIQGWIYSWNMSIEFLFSCFQSKTTKSYPLIWNLGTPDFMYDFTMFFIYMILYLNS